MISKVYLVEPPTGRVRYASHVFDSLLYISHMLQNSVGDYNVKFPVLSHILYGTRVYFNNIMISSRREHGIKRTRVPGPTVPQFCVEWTMIIVLPFSDKAVNN